MRYTQRDSHPHGFRDQTATGSHPSLDHQYFRRRGGSSLHGGSYGIRTRSSVYPATPGMRRKDKNASRLHGMHALNTKLPYHTVIARLTHEPWQPASPRPPCQRGLAAQPPGGFPPHRGVNLVRDLHPPGFRRQTAASLRPSVLVQQQERRGKTAIHHSCWW